MQKNSTRDHSLLDDPEVTQRIFHPRSDARRSAQGSGERLVIPVDEKVSLDAKFHGGGKTDPNVLFFHGNGEIVSDYDDLGPLYSHRNINFTVVDYRGYGLSTGSPTVTHILKDAHAVLDFFTRWLAEKGYSGPLAVMGRSLGSASALELAAHARVKPKGLILESAFAYELPLFQLLGVPVKRLGLREDDGFRHLEKIRAHEGPLLVIHAEFDHIIPFSDATALYEASPSRQKTFLKIPHANHNDIFYRGLNEYMGAISTFLKTLH